MFTKASEKVYRMIDGVEGVHSKVKSALETIDEAFQIYQWDLWYQRACISIHWHLRPHELIIAFTGGKDCTVLLHLIHAYCQRHYPTNRPVIRALIVRTRPSFKEVEDFIKKSLTNYGIVPPRSNFLEFNGPMKGSLEILRDEHPEIKAVFMGTKRTDPNGSKYRD